MAYIETIPSCGATGETADVYRYVGADASAAGVGARSVLPAPTETARQATGS
jgi:hypothetical protein